MSEGYKSEESMEINGNKLEAPVPRRNHSEYQQTSLSPSQTIDIAFKNISYTISSSSCFSKEKKKILNDVSGEFRSGELTAIMGPSGAGKTCLLNVLSGFIKKGVSGTVYANGLLVDSKRIQTKSHSAYVMQEDHLNPLFTVRETMLLAANLKLGHKYSPNYKQLLIQDLLESMSMSEAGNTMCGKLSGGQRKRLNVCLELIDNPPILFLDEPTSGLDISNCRLLATKLKEIATAGRTVVCTIHQPSALVLSMFDHLYLLNSGMTVFQGEVTNLLPFLNFVGLPCPVFHNPADFIMDIVSGEFGAYSDKLMAANASKSWRKDDFKLQSTSLNSDILELREWKRPSPSEWLRYRYLVSQLCKQLHRDWVVTYLKCALHLLVAGLLGVLFYKNGDDASIVYNNTMYLFITTLYISYTTLMPATLKFPNQMLVLKKEHFNNWYKLTTYFLAFLTINTPIQLFLTSIFYVISYLLTGQLIEVRRCSIVAVTASLETIIADMLGILLGSAQNPVNGIFVGSALLIVITMFGGCLVPLKDLTGFMRFISSMNYFRYTFELKVTAAYGLERRKLPCPEEALYCHIRNPKMVFEQFGLEDNQVTRDLVIVFLITLSSILLAFYRLKYSIKKFK